MKDFKDLVDQYNRLSKDSFDFEKFNSFSITYHSTALEGSTLSKIEAEVLLEKNLTPKGKPISESLMVLDHQKALEYTLELANQKTPLEVTHIQKISSLVLKNSLGPVNCAAGTYDPSKGEFRLNSVYAGELTFPSADKVENLLKNFLNEFNNQVKNVTKVDQIYNLSFQSKYQLYNIHPFADGNSRLSRLIMNYVQRYHDVPLSIVSIESRVEYKKSISRSRSDQNIKPFIDFMKTETSDFFNKQINLLSKQPRLNRGIDGGISFLF